MSGQAPKKELALVAEGNGVYDKEGWWTGREEGVVPVMREEVGCGQPHEGPRAQEQGRENL